MRPLYEEYDELDFDFADNATMRQMMREQQREERRLASRRSFGPRNRPKFEDYEEKYEDYESYEEYDEYDDYDEDEFDSYSDAGTS